jgi:hypothetical protein
MKSFFTVTALFCALVFSSHVNAAVSDGTPITQEEMRPLASWVEQATHVKMRALPIAMASGVRLKTMIGLKGSQQARSLAAYLPGQIVVNNIIWDPESIRSQSYLLHELVHHAQLLSGKRYPCTAAKEREAYMLQNQWLKEHGEDEAVDQDWIDDKATCKSKLL